MPYRAITTDMWSDPAFAELSSPAQLVFIRLIAGPETTAAGTTCVLPKMLAATTNLERDQVEQAIEELIAAKLVRRYDEWLWLPGWVEHQINGAGFIAAARRVATTRGVPRALATAITRSLDARFGTPKSDTPRTGKKRNSRANGEAPGSLPAASREVPGGYQYQDPLPSGGGGPGAAAPAPGAQAQQRADDKSAAVATAERAAHSDAMASAAEGVADHRVAELLRRQAERLRLVQESAESMPDPGPPPDPEPAFTGTLEQEEVVSAAGLRRWEEAEILAWHQTGDPSHLRQLERHGSAAARAAVVSLLADSGHPPEEAPPRTARASPPRRGARRRRKALR